MPVSYQLQPELSRIRTRCEGDVKFQEVIDHFRELAGESLSSDRLNVFLDLTRIESLPDVYQIGQISDEMRLSAASIPWGACVVVTSDDAMYGMVRMLQVFADQVFSDFAVFREMDEAEDWLTSQS